MGPLSSSKMASFVNEKVFCDIRKRGTLLGGILGMLNWQRENFSPINFAILT
jgi:hypothetical protein